MQDPVPEEQALPTSNGEYVLFRSTLESRWAMAFEFLKINWYYEPNRFPLPNGSYLPDFFLPGIGWIEIKPTFDKLKEVESRLRTFALHKSDLLENDLPFYSISSEYPTFRFTSGTGDSMLLEWLSDGKVRQHGRDYAIETLRSQEKTALYEASRERYTDFADRAMTKAQDAHIDEPLPLNAVMALTLRSMEKEQVEAPDEPEDSEVQLSPPDWESGAPF